MFLLFLFALLSYTRDSLEQDHAHVAEEVENEEANGEPANFILGFHVVVKGREDNYEIAHSESAELVEQIHFVHEWIYLRSYLAYIGEENHRREDQTLHLNERETIAEGDQERDEGSSEHKQRIIHKTSLFVSLQVLVKHAYSFLVLFCRQIFLLFN